MLTAEGKNNPHYVKMALEEDVLEGAQRESAFARPLLMERLRNPTSFCTSSSGEA